MDIQKGGNAPLNATIVEGVLSYGSRPQGLDVDMSAYLLGPSGTVRGDEDMLFYNHPATADGAIRIDPATGGFRIDTAAVPADVERIAICTVVDGGPASSLGEIALTVADGPAFRHDVSSATEAAIIVAEFYRRAGVWKMRAVGQGFDGGLAPLATHFGIDVAGDAAAKDDAAPEPAPAPAPAPPPASKVNLTKVTLQKAASVNLRKGAGSIRARLIWEGRGAGDGDLDFYCFYVLKDGTCGKVYWKDLGRADAAPWITLSGDSMTAGEEAIVLHRPEDLRFALFAAYSAVANGAGSFASYRPRMIMTDADGSEVTIPLLNPNHTSYWVAITHVSVDRDITIKHVETYGKGGLSIFAAERAPRLHADGTWDVSKGEIEFKGR